MDIIIGLLLELLLPLPEGADSVLYNEWLIIFGEVQFLFYLVSNLYYKYKQSEHVTV